MKALPLFHRIDGEHVMVLGEGEMAEAKRRLVERAGGIIVGDDDRDAKIAFIALENPELAAVRLRARGVLVNVVDRLDLSDFTVPSILDRDPVLVAVGTGGASAGLAKQLRLRLEGLIPGNLGRLADALQSVRNAWRERWPDAADRRRALDAALAPGGPLDPLADGSAEKVEDWLNAADAPEATGPIELTIASDDPDDLTLRQARLLGNADAILHEAGISPAILKRARSDAQRLPLDAEPPAGLVLILRRG